MKRINLELGLFSIVSIILPHVYLYFREEYMEKFVTVNFQNSIFTLGAGLSLVGLFRLFILQKQNKTHVPYVWASILFINILFVVAVLILSRGILNMMVW